MQQVNKMTKDLGSNIRKRMSFSRKLALTFFLITLITFLIIDTIMHVIYEKIITEDDFITTSNINAFNQFSNQEVLSATNAYLTTGLDVYQEIIFQIYGSYEYFQDNPGIFVSNEQKGVNPPLTSTFATPRYDRSSVFFYTDDATFFNQPYIDQSLSSVITPEYPPLLKRVNIFYQDPQNQDNLMARTVPATDEFIIPNSSIISQRISSCIPGSIILTNQYEDVLSLNNTQQNELIALRLLISNGTDDGFDMLIQVQLDSEILNTALENVYSFPSTNILIIKTLDGGSGYSVLGQISEPASIDLQDYFTPGHYDITVDDTDMLLTTTIPTVQEDNASSVSRRMLQKQSSNRLLTDDFSQNNNLVTMIFLNISQTSQPNDMYLQFLSKQKETLVFMLYGWTFIILAFTCSIGLVIGHYLFSYFSLILKKCKTYIKNPQKIKQIHLEMKKLSSNEKRNRLLMQNLIQIMRRIQNKKNINKKKPIKETDQFPLNLLNTDFQNRMRLKDGLRFQAIADQLEQSIQNATKEEKKDK